MKRPLFWCSALFIAGIYTKHFLPQSAAALLLLIIICTAIAKTIKTRNLYSAFVSLLLLLSFIFGSFVIDKGNTDKSLFPYVNSSYTLKLRVCEKPELKGDYCVYICDALSVTTKDGEYKLNDKIRLTHYSDELSLSLGDIFSAKCRITTAKENQNRDSFDYRLYLKTKGIFFTGHINNDIDIISKDNYTFFDRFKLLNMRLCKIIDMSFPENKATFLKAILLGEKSDMTPEYYSSFKRSGLSHVIAVSGMHLSYLVIMLSFLRKQFKPDSLIYSLAMIFFVFGFMCLTGMTSSVIRAGIMVICVFSGNMLSRKTDSISSLGFSAFIILINNPYAAFSQSFILSYSATLGILIFAKPLEEKLIPNRTNMRKSFFIKIKKGIISTFAVSLGAQIFTLPPAIIMFKETSLWSLPANILIAPFCPLILASGFLFCMSSIANLPLSPLLKIILSLLINIFEFIINLFSSLDFGIIHFSEDNGMFFVLAFLLILITVVLMLYKRKRLVILPACMLITTLVLFSANAISDTDSAYVSFINVGQADSTLITLPENINILIDGGDYAGTDSGNYENTPVNSYLSSKNINRIDFLIATHPHSDHIGGLFAVMEYAKVGCLIVPPYFENSTIGAELLEKARLLSIPVYCFQSGNNISFSDSIKLTALMPDDYFAKANAGENNSSLVLRLDYYNTSFLFTGDLESFGERYMMRLVNDDTLDVDVLKVAHHGSDTSTSEEFINKTSPKFSFIPSDNNSASKEVLERLEDAKSQIFRSDLNKDVRFVLTSEGINNIIYN